MEGHVKNENYSEIYRSIKLWWSFSHRLWDFYRLGHKYFLNLHSQLNTCSITKLTWIKLIQTKWHWIVILWCLYYLFPMYLVPHIIQKHWVNSLADSASGFTRSPWLHQAISNFLSHPCSFNLNLLRRKIFPLLFHFEFPQHLYLFTPGPAEEGRACSVLSITQ